MTRQKETPDLIHEVLADADSDQGHSEKLQAYSGAKRHSVAVAEYLLSHELTLYREAEQLKSCASWLIFRHFHQAGKYRLIGGCTCRKHLLCAMCALRRSARFVQQYAQKIQAIMRFCGDSVNVLLTLTVKNGADLSERFEHLNSAFTRMVDNRRRALSGSRHQTVFRDVLGLAGSYEVKRGKGSGLWHPHFHAIAILPSYIDLPTFQKNLSQEWQRLTGDSSVVDVRPIDTFSEKLFLGGICEVFRYVLKFGQMEICDQVEAFKVLSGRTLVRNFGLLRCPEPTDLHDSIEDELALQPYLDLVYQYVGERGYILDRVTDTKDQYTNPSHKIKETEGSKASSRLSSRLFITIPDPEDRRKKKKSIDQSYVNEWVKENPVESSYIPEEVPF